VVADGGPGLWDTAPWNTTAFGQAPHYHLLNFDDTFSAFITLWVLLIQNNWHVVAEGYQLVLGTRWTRLYFTSYNVVVQVMMLSMLIGVIINQFSKITEDETLKAKGQERPEMVFMDEIRNRLALAIAPSGKQYMELWEVYEDDTLLGSEMKHDQMMVLQRNTISHSNAQVLLDTVGTPIIGRTEDGFVCYANHSFLDLCCYGSKLNQVVDTEFKAYFSPDIHALAQSCQGTTGSFLWHDVTSTLERKASGRIWNLQYAPMDFYAQMGTTSTVPSESGLVSDQQGQAMVYWMSLQVEIPDEPMVLLDSRDKIWTGCAAPQEFIQAGRSLPSMPVQQIPAPFTRKVSTQSDATISLGGSLCAWGGVSMLGPIQAEPDQCGLCCSTAPL